MKTKTFFILCLLISIASVRTFSQVNEEEKLHTYSEWGTENSWIRMECNGTFIEDFTGETEIHYVRHYTGGIFDYYIAHLKGEFTSSKGEIFKISEVDKTKYDEGLTLNANLVGNRGTHYILSATVSWSQTQSITVTWTYDKEICLDNKNK